MAGVVAKPVLRGRMGHGRLDHCQLVGPGVGVGVARSQDAGQGFAGVIGEAEDGVGAALEVAGGGLLVLGVDIDQGGVDVEHHLLGCLQ